MGNQIHMTLEELDQRLKQPKTDKEEYRHFSVLLPLIQYNGELHVLYEVRASHMKTQPGEVCFPGGRLECNESPMEAAIRETTEELGLPGDAIHILAEIDPVITPFNLILHVFVGVLNLEHPSLENGLLTYQDTSDRQQLQLNPDEVAEVFLVPLSWLIQHPPKVYTATSKMSFPEDFPFHLIQNGEAYNWRIGQYPIMFYDNSGPTIWGITARITKGLIDRLQTQQTP